MATLKINIIRGLDGEHPNPRPAPPDGNSWQLYRVFYEGELLGVWRDPEHSAARELIAKGLATRDNTLQTYRGDVHSMSGKISWFADTKATEDDDHGPRTVKWVPFPGIQVRAGVPSDDSDG